MRGVDRVGAVGDDDHHLAARVAQEVPEQVHGVGSGPVDVVEHDQAGADRVGEQAGDRLEQALAAGGGTGRRGGPGQSARQVRCQLVELAEECRCRVGGGREGERLPHELRERLEVLDGVGLARSDDDGRARDVDGLGEALDQHALAHPALAADEHELWRAVDRIRPARAQRVELRGPADEVDGPTTADRVERRAW